MATKPDLLAAIQAADADDLASIDQRIEELTRELESLKAARRVVDVAVNGKAKAQRKSGGGSAPAGESDEELRERIHDLLSKKGEAIKPAEIGHLLGGYAAQKVGKLVNHEWFVKTPEGITIA